MIQSFPTMIELFLRPFVYSLWIFKTLPFGLKLNLIVFVYIFDKITRNYFEISAGYYDRFLYWQFLVIIKKRASILFCFLQF